jgi:hypothetical protein
MSRSSVAESLLLGCLRVLRSVLANHAHSAVQGLNEIGWGRQINNLGEKCLLSVGQAPGSEYFAEIERRTDADSRAAA